MNSKLIFGIILIIISVILGILGLFGSLITSYNKNINGMATKGDDPLASASGLFIIIASISLFFGFKLAGINFFKFGQNKYFKSY